MSLALTIASLILLPAIVTLTINQRNVNIIRARKAKMDKQLEELQRQLEDLERKQG
jgi:type II secretory pathway component PulJ